MDFELDEMRQQMAILKNKLDDQTIVNDRLIRRAVKNSVSTINKRYLVISIIAYAQKRFRERQLARHQTQNP